MPFEEGKSGNPNGRPKGAENKATARIKEAFVKLLEDNIEQLAIDVKKMQPQERAYFLKDLAEYVLPKLSRVKSEVTTDDKTQVIKIGYGKTEPGSDTN
jgi:hypothetical protein